MMKKWVRWFLLKNMKYENTIKQLAPDKHRGDVISELLKGDLITEKDVFELVVLDALFVKEGEGADLGIRCWSGIFYSSRFFRSSM